MKVVRTTKCVLFVVAALCVAGIAYLFATGIHYPASEARITGSGEGYSRGGMPLLQARYLFTDVMLIYPVGTQIRLPTNRTTQFAVAGLCLESPLSPNEQELLTKCAVLPNDNLHTNELMFVPLARYNYPLVVLLLLVFVVCLAGICVLSALEIRTMRGQLHRPACAAVN